MKLTPDRLFIAFMLLALPLQAQNAGTAPASVTRFLHAADSMNTPVSGKYVGPGSCSAVACHGGIAPRSITPVLQNEYSTWVTQDKHALAYRALTEPLGRQMSSILKIGPAEKAQKCLVCHAVDTEAAHRSREFDTAEGVSCESCHGAASGWLGPHFQHPGTYTEMVAKYGLVDNRNLSVRSARCLTCHLGAPGLSVDHEMIAAGHPDLKFELDSYTAVQPPHWVEKSPDPLFGMRAWGVGEAVEVRESMLRVKRHAESGPWPEFSEMDCITCHHSLTGPQSWRQQEGYGDHRPGDPPYNLSRYIVFKHFAQEIDPEAERQLNKSATEVARLITSMSPDRTTVEQQATAAAAAADKLTGEVEAASYDRARTERLLRSIAADGDAISRSGERTAEQAYMTLDSLYIALAKAGGANAATRAALDKAYVQLKNPSAYNAPQFAAAMKGVAGTVK